MDKEKLNRLMAELDASNDPAWMRLADLNQEPRFFHPDGEPIITDELLPDFYKWALLFEDAPSRIVARTQTFYGETLSTVWMGLEHGYQNGRPLIFETMLFAPAPANVPKHILSITPEERKAREEERAYNEKYFPHHQLQLRYSSEQEAKETHELLVMQCLIPPRWRHFLLWTIGRDATWSHYDEEDDEG